MEGKALATESAPVCRLVKVAGGWNVVIRAAAPCGPATFGPFTKPVAQSFARMVEDEAASSAETLVDFGDGKGPVPARRRRDGSWTAKGTSIDIWA